MNRLLLLLNDVALMKALPGFTVKLVCTALSIFNNACEYSLYYSLALSPKQLPKKKLRSNMTSSFAPFGQYMDDLANGKLDGYLDSTHPEDKPSVPGIVLLTDPQLLLHNLGKHPDMKRIKRLFLPGTVFVICGLANVATTDLVFPHSATCSASLVQGKPVFPLMVSALIGGFISPAEATVSSHADPATSI
jgi:hypothetical protein